MGYNSRTRKIAPHYTAQSAATHHPDEKKMKKTILGEKDIVSEDIHAEDCTHDENDQDSSISFDDEDSTACQEDDFEDWIQYIKRRTKEAADEKLLTCNITNWIETQKKLRWREALRIAAQNPGRFTRKAPEWNPGLILLTGEQEDQPKDGKTT